MREFISVRLAVFLSGLTALILALMPFHAFLTVWVSSFTGHYLLVRLWKEAILTLLIVGILIILAADKELRRKFFSSYLILLIIAYVVFLAIWGAAALAGHRVTGRAMWYGLLVDSRFLIFFLVALVVSVKTGSLYTNWKRLLFVPAVLVALFAIIQYLFLPYDFLKHFGYGESTIFPYETINHNLNHLRVASTLRGANPLGAYMLMPLLAVFSLLLKNRNFRYQKIALSIVFLLAIVFSFSRSAWIGCLIAVVFIFSAGRRKIHLKKSTVLILAALIIALGALMAVMRDNANFENIFFHTDNGSTVQNSNEGHRMAFDNAFNDLIHEPFGRGVGTAGPQSAYNIGHFMRIAENFFLQIGQEAGWLAMAAFIAICVIVGRHLWFYRDDSFALWLLASLIGISFINLLSHAWSDDTLAYVWWGLAGIYLGPAILTVKAKQSNAKKIKNQA
jgi:hypothetical protein